MIRLAWRNIWRNRRRSLITIASVFVAVFLTVIMMSYTNGAWGKLIDNMLHTQAGHIEIHQKGYWNDKVIDNFMTMDNETITLLRKTNNVESVAPRVEIFALAATEKITKGVAIVGIDPVEENKKSQLAKRLVEGNYLDSNDTGILIGKKLSDYLQAKVGDSLAIIGQGYHGASAVGLFPVRGIVSLITPDMDRNMLYMTVSSAQDFISMPDGYSGMLIALNDGNQLKTTIRTVEEKIDSSVYEVFPWTITMDRLLKQKESDQGFGIIVLVILYLIVGFGILGTVLMMTNERRREFGMMIALGMQRGKLWRNVSAELTLMSLVGAAAALIVCVPIVWYFHVHPISLSGEMATMMIAYGIDPVLPMDASPALFINQVFIVLLITCITMIYPIRVIRNLETSKAIRL